MLEQQWQPVGAQRPLPAPRAVRQRPGHLQPRNPNGSHITVGADQRHATRPERELPVGTFSFLGAGGDNFTAFTQGTNTRDSGLVDRDGWIEYLQNASPITPDFARQQVKAANFKRSVKPNKKYHFTVSGLDLTSLGSPQSTEVGVYGTAVVKNKPEQVKLGEFPVSNGVAKVNFRTPDIRFSQLSVVAEPSDTTVGIFHGTFNHQIKAKPRLATSKAPKPALVGKTRTVVEIEVKVPGMTPKGWASVKIGGKEYKGKLVDGKVSIKLPKFHHTGEKELKVKYLGNDKFKRAHKFINLWVVRG